MSMQSGIDPDGDPLQFSEEAWVEVLRSVDRTYSQLVEHQVTLEARNTELEGMRSFLTSILGAMNDVLLVCGQEGQVLEANHAFLELSGREKADTLGTQLADAFAEGDRAALRSDFERLRRGQLVPTAERTLATAGEPAPLELSVTARRDKRGRFIGAVLIGRPVGELRRAYSDMEESHRALKEAQSQLVHSEKLASLGRLLAGVAHELNNPISFVYGNAHALERYTQRFETYFERVEAGAERAELIQLREELKLDRAVRNMRTAVSGALEGAERVRDLVESLRRLSADGSGEVERFDLAETARTAALWVIKGRASTVPLEVAAPAPVPCLGRPGHIQQVVMNLVQNGLDAMEEVAEPHLDLAIRTEEGQAVLEVADCGPGIAEDVALRIFDPFFTTKPVGKGTGLGLSISYKIVAENDGTLTAETRPEGGALFRLCLPAAPAPGSGG